MAIWNEKYAISNGEQTTDSTARPIYRSFPECGINTGIEEIYNEIAQDWKIYFETTDLKDIVFTPKTVLQQSTSKYHFMHLTVRFPRNG